MARSHTHTVRIHNIHITILSENIGYLPYSYKHYSQLEIIPKNIMNHNKDKLTNYHSAAHGLQQLAGNVIISRNPACFSTKFDHWVALLNVRTGQKWFM